MSFNVRDTTQRVRRSIRNDRPLSKPSNVGNALQSIKEGLYLDKNPHKRAVDVLSDLSQKLAQVKEQLTQTQNLNERYCEEITQLKAQVNGEEISQLKAELHASKSMRQDTEKAFIEQVRRVDELQTEILNLPSIEAHEQLFNEVNNHLYTQAQMQLTIDQLMRQVEQQQNHDLSTKNSEDEPLFIDLPQPQSEEIESLEAPQRDSKELNGQAPPIIYSNDQQLLKMVKNLNNNSKDYSLLLEIGRRLKKENKYSEAIYYLKRAIQINPSSFTGYLAIGEVYHALKKVSLTLDAYLKALKCDPNQHLIHKQMAIFFNEVLGNKKFAHEYATRSLELNSDQPDLIEWIKGIEDRTVSFWQRVNLGVAQL